ncbi:Type 1 glutamine amidotransferase-like domain-containing protein [Mesobacillus subterraneus]|uniref:Peptidase S51 n=1 Tax=Mesobacillus subterraneus TaxID=285983 RepID=A0A3R9FIG9_9BACI|nr:Type 1 glutamine amidotransferase-like domain-containing protein [Mesobacillus subterraneus]RSD28808.1 hypothetical protein EJA10_04355 [Mesobacillus subterraneus]
MYRLALLSNVRVKNPFLKEKISKLIGSEGFKLAYIPSQTDWDKKYFSMAKPELEALGVTEFLYVDVDQECQENIVEELSNCDGIFLSGGNTYYFMKNLKEKGVLPLIKQMAESGKPLIGVSAGSIIMCETIQIAKYFDENEVQLDQLDGLGLVVFEFFPHWESYDQQQGAILDYSMVHDSSIFACGEEDGIIVNGNEIELCGAINEVRRGKNP